MQIALLLSAVRMFILCGLLVAQSANSAFFTQAKLPIRISEQLFHLSWLKESSNFKNLERLTFTVVNVSDRHLEWIKIRMVYRNSRGALLQTETIERDFSKQPLGPGDAKQITVYTNIQGFTVGKTDGSVSIEPVDARFKPAAPTITESPRDQTAPAQNP